MAPEGEAVAATIVTSLEQRPAFAPPLVAAAEGGSAQCAGPFGPATGDGVGQPAGGGIIRTTCGITNCWLPIA